LAIGKASVGQASGVVLCGGQSSRMGINKAFLELDGEPLIGRVVDKLAALSDDLIISANEPELFSGFPARIISDMIPNGGPLSGIHAALMTARHDRAIVVACDMPLLNLSLLRYMLAVGSGFDAVVPRWRGYHEPLHAIYSIRCVEPIEQILAQGRRRIVALFDQVSVREVSEQEVRLFDTGSSFFNVNTPEDWERAQRLDQDFD
jgi:molybdopterin-guanine dinucleotide biosynthesis protein A